MALDVLAEEKDQVTGLEGRLTWEWLDGFRDQMAAGRVFMWRGDVCWLYVGHDGAWGGKGGREDLAMPAHGLADSPR